MADTLSLRPKGCTCPGTEAEVTDQISNLAMSISTGSQLTAGIMGMCNRQLLVALVCAAGSVACSTENEDESLDEAMALYRSMRDTFRESMGSTKN